MSSLHSRQTITDGIHTAISYQFADTTARQATGAYYNHDLGKIAWQEDANTFWVLTGFDAPGNNATPNWIPLGGEANQGQNIGNGAGLYAGKDGIFLQLRSIEGGENVSVTQDTNELIINTNENIPGKLLEEETKDSNYTLALSDGFKIITNNTAVSITITIPNDATVFFPVGTQIMIGRKSSGAISLNPDTDVSLNGDTTLLTLAQQWKGITVLWKYATNEWWAMGGIV